MTGRRRRWAMTDRREEAAAALEDARRDKSQARSLVARLDRVRDDLLAHGRVNGFEARIQLALRESR